VTARDLGETAARCWKEHGRALAELWRVLTPAQFVALFWAPAAPPAFDPVAVLRAANDRRAAAGRRPAVPAWLFPRVPSARAPRPTKKGRRRA
jgi:hypothetical protein